RVGDQCAVRGSCWSDPLAEPPAISFTPKTGPDAGTPRQGIYRLDGESLTVCLAYPGHPRPTAFVAQPEVQQVRVYRRGAKAGAGAAARTRARAPGIRSRGSGSRIAQMSARFS